jgi:hypothetical protein
VDYVPGDSICALADALGILGAAAIVACFYLFATKDSYRPMKDLNFVICKTQAQMLNRPVRALRSNVAAGS